ncbi:cytochrome c3 family protein [Geoalkalibacter halelectricus]|uniref:cytochrome c3 family protein n=1 Tax=Geoalkalibacter halelectricus TaxID=2847045 RepID=UPI002670602E|nr:cytochrome c3 family protein [Geoalkalibacter halelectricus]MDO3378796.1 cytochrome c family protein [Geoalkalibacter halelectricus]
MKILWPIALLVFLFVAAPVLSEQEEMKVPDEVTFPARLGDVHFSHIDHANWVPDCTTCHHTGAYPKCSSCHGVREDARRKTDAFHMQCKGCHQEVGLSTACADCHIR